MTLNRRHAGGMNSAMANLKKIDAQSAVNRWNEEHPVGTAVEVLLDSGERKETYTVSPAEVLSGHSAVIWLNGVRGCYLLSRVTPKPAAANHQPYV